MSWWLKRVHWTDDREDAAYWRVVPWVSDAPGRTSDVWPWSQGDYRAERNPQGSCRSSARYAPATKPPIGRTGAKVTSKPPTATRHRQRQPSYCRSMPSMSR